MKQANVRAVGKIFGGVQGHAPWESFKTGLVETQFPAFPGPEAVNREGLLRQ